MFIDVNDNVEVKVYYVKKGRVYEGYTEKEYSQLNLRDDARKKFECLNIVMRQLTWGLQNDLQDNALIDLPNGNSKFHYKTFKETKLEKTIVSWDAKDKDEKNIRATVEVVRELSPEIADAILRGYDEQSLLGDAEEKK